MWKFLRPDAKAVLKDEGVRDSLPRYFAVVKGRRPAKFLIAKRLPAKFVSCDSSEELWEEHEALLERFSEVEREIDDRERVLEDMPRPKKSFLDLKIEIAQKILASCHFCTRRCGVNRLEGELGYCRCGEEILVSSIFEHLGEEPELVPSGTIFTMGCTMRCLHCQNWAISQWKGKGEVSTTEELAAAVDELRSRGCRNANLVGGDPTPWLWHWLRTFRHVDSNIPVVWNSNSYYSVETARLLAGFVDVYLLDFKYGPAECAANISDAPGYWEVCTRNHQKARITGDLIIRVLVLPQHIDCCVKPILNWIAENLGTEVRVNLMFQYRPEWRANEIPELRRRLTRAEMRRSIDLAEQVNLTNFIT